MVMNYIELLSYLLGINVDTSQVIPILWVEFQPSPNGDGGSKSYHINQDYVIFSFTSINPR